MCVDETNSPYRNNIYMSWTEFDSYGSSNPNDSTRILFSRSIDAGITWSQPVKISDVGGDCIDSDNTVEGAVPAVGPNGEVYLSWSGPLGIMFDKSIDGGVTFGQDIFVTDQPEGWDFGVPGIYRCNGLPITACDISNSPHRGNIYIAWSDQRNGFDDTDIFLIKSTDRGTTWGNVKRVNDDNTNRHQFFTWMTIDQLSGSIYFVFYDRRNTSVNETEVYVARSDDGGETFTNFKVSESPFTPNDMVFFGDYTNIAARNGKIYPIWMRMDGFDLSIWTAIVDIPVGITSVEEQMLAENFELWQNYPNPFNPSTQIHYLLPRAETVRLVIYNTLGQLIKTLVFGKQETGAYTATWDGTDEAGARMTSGVYLVRMTAGDYVQTRKMILMQ
jgi:hypothetical protein